MNGVNPATFFFLPMLNKHPDEYPRFRDCFLYDNDHPEYDEHILIYTRTGGGNREAYTHENNVMREMPGYVTDWDGEFDSTFAMWVFRVPEKWKVDYHLIMNSKINEVSIEYQKQMKKVFPKLAYEFNKLFNK